MGFMDKLNVDKLKQTLSQNRDKVEMGLDKAADAVDSLTKGKYSDKIDSGADKAKDALGKLGDDEDGKDQGKGAKSGA
ncbi:antitoxin [Streptomyces sp. XC 2026]|nr:antitoxin [Streptomyces sp. XC 2026]